MHPRPRLRLQAKLTLSYLLVGSALMLTALLATLWIERRAEAEDASRAETLRAATALASTLDSAFEEGFSYALGQDPQEKANFFRRIEAFREHRLGVAADPNVDAEQVAALAAMVRPVDAAVAAATRMFADAEDDGRVLPASYKTYEVAMDEVSHRLDVFVESARVLGERRKLTTINDQGGHVAGDEALAAAGHALRHATRATDIVGRYGGDEFVAVLPNTAAVGAQVVVARILEAFRGLSVPTLARRFDVSASIGVCTLEEPAAPIEGFQDASPDAFTAVGQELLRRADAALYVAKRDGRARAAAPEALAWTEAFGPGALAPPSVAPLARA